MSKRATEDWHRWVGRSLLNGAGAAHKWCNEANKLPDLQLTFKETLADGSSRIVTDPYEVVQHHAEPWAKVWQCGNTELADLEFDKIKQLRLQYANDADNFADTMDLSPGAIRRGCGAFKTSTAIGVDDWAFKEIHWLPDEALIPLGTLLGQMVRKMLPPVQVMAILITLLGKKGGDREQSQTSQPSTGSL